MTDRETLDAAWTIVRDRKAMIAEGHKVAVDWAWAYIDAARAEKQRAKTEKK